MLTCNWLPPPLVTASDVHGFATNPRRTYTPPALIHLRCVLFPFSRTVGQESNPHQHEVLCPWPLLCMSPFYPSKRPISIAPSFSFIFAVYVGRPCNVLFPPPPFLYWYPPPPPPPPFLKASPWNPNTLYLNFLPLSGRFSLNDVTAPVRSPPSPVPEMGNLCE